MRQRQHQSTLIANLKKRRRSPHLEAAVVRRSGKQSGHLEEQRAGSIAFEGFTSAVEPCLQTLREKGTLVRRDQPPVIGAELPFVDFPSGPPWKGALSTGG